MTTTLGQPIVLHRQYVVCDGRCQIEFETVTDGFRAYAHADNAEANLFARSTTTLGQIRTACPSIDSASDERCDGEIVVDLTSDRWEAATPATLDLIGYGEQIETD